MVILAGFTMLACYIYDPSMKLLLYSGLPASFQNPVTFWLCMMEEVHFFVRCTSMAVHMWQLQVIAFDLGNSNVAGIIEKLMSIR